MATRAGRGRGRGSDSSSSSGKVGVDKQKKISKSVDELKEYLMSLNEDNLTKYGDQFATMVLGFSTNEAQLTKAVNMIFDVVVDSRDNALLGACVCRFIVQQSKSDDGDIISKRKLFLKTLLSRFQSEFNNKIATRSTSIEQWLAIFSFLCEVFQCVKLTDGNPINVAGKAIVTCMNWLLSNEDCDDDEVECVANYFKTSGEGLSHINKKGVQEIVCLLRKRVVSSQSSCKVRCVVMEVLEYRAMGWKDVEDELNRFYLDAITDAAVEDDLATMKGGSR